MRNEDGSLIFYNVIEAAVDFVFGNRVKRCGRFVKDDLPY